MKTNWNLVIILLMIVVSLFGVYKLVKIYNKKAEIITNNSIMVDSLSNRIYQLDKSIDATKQSNQKLEEDKLVLTSQIERLKKNINDVKIKKPAIVNYPYSDSAKYTIISEYFTSKNIPLHYAGSKR